MTATAFAVAVIVCSCGGKLRQAENLNMDESPVQTLDSMFLVQTENGMLKMRVEAGVMERYSNDTMSYELFPKGLSVFAYNDDGLLETTVRSDNARHEKTDEEEIWKAYGHVVVRNVINMETMETDTLYWDRAEKEIYTDCYVKLFSPKGYMQGFGLRSDEMARRSVIERPFNSYGVVVSDTASVIVDTANLIGPLPK